MSWSHESQLPTKSSEDTSHQQDLSKAEGMEVREINTPTLFCLLLCPCLPLAEHNQKQDKGRPHIVVHRGKSLGTEKEENESGLEE